jgi:endonuclease/exonuclease/phosphatase (EEP) superfamily protein YafD
VPKSIRWLLAFAAAFGLLGLMLLVLALAPEAQAGHQWLAMAASFAPYGSIAWGAAVVLALVGARGRTRLVVAPLALGLAWHIGLLAPYLPGPTHKAAGQTESLTVLELNLHFGQADLTQLAADVDRFRPDVVVLTEVTRSDEKTFKNRSWSRALPYQAGTAGDDYDPAAGTGDARGTLVLSRQPLTQLEVADGTLFSDFAVRLDVSGKHVTLIAAHAANPEHGLDRWLGDGEALTRLALAHGSGPLIVAGDLNATAEHLTLRTLSAKAGLTDTASGEGWHPTYPADAWYPPLIQIDHVLVSRQFSTTGFQTVRVAGTDHLGLLVTLAFS